MFQNYKISTKIFSGFLPVLFLLAAIAAFFIFTLKNSNSNFKQYRSTALQTNQAGRIQSNLLEARLAVKNFIIQASEENIEIVKTRAGATIKLNQEFSTMPVSDKDKQVIAETNEYLTEYLNTFEKISSLQDKRNELVVGTLNKIGPKMEKDLTRIMQSAYQDNDTAAAFLAGMTQRNLLLMRLYATKYLVTNEEAAFERVQTESKAMKAAHHELSRSLQNPTRRKVAAEVTRLHEEYDAAFKKVHETIVSRNNLISGTLDRIGPTVAKSIESAKLRIKAEQDTIGPKASADMEQAVTTTVVVSLVGIVLGIIVALLIGRMISRPIQNITTSMSQLAEGDKTIEIPGQSNKDEIGDMASAVQIFKENMIKADELSAREEEAFKLREERSQRIENLTSEFEGKVAGLLDDVSNSVSAVDSNALVMSGLADDTSHRSTTVASAAEEASVNTQTVASATEQLSASIGEIGAQVYKAAEITSNAVSEAEKTNGQVQNLSGAAHEIGKVVNLISDIAEQTNLLALNATIEAARAGDAGRGFAVVAAEVKELADQTSKATGEIGQQINTIQCETNDAVSSIQLIGEIINEINEIASGISAAVEQQGAATNEISSSVTQASAGAQEVTENIIEVTKFSSQTGEAAVDVKKSATELTEKADSLSSVIQVFLQDVKSC